MNTQSTWARGADRPDNWKARAKSVASRGRRPFAYGALLTFSALYYYRPEDFIPGLNYIPMARIAGGIGAVALLAGLSGGGKVKMPAVIKILWLLLLQIALCVPFALWRGGAFAIFEIFAKAMIVALLISIVVVTVAEIRKLLWIQVSAVALVTFFSIVLHHTRNGRLEGIQKSILENPNDLAINIAISFPLGVAFMLHARGFRKFLWAIGLAFMSLGIVLTYSRSGLLAFSMTIAICVWEYGIKGKRRYLVGIAGALFLVGLGIVASSASYRVRVESLLLGNIEGSGDRGSIDARKELLKKSVMLALKHPFFGVGPGCFALVDEGWMVAHNTYTELAAEAGILALVLFLMAFGAALKNIALVRKSQQYRSDPEVRLFTQALWAGIVAYLVGACFASTEYTLYPYFMVAYTCAMVRIVSMPVSDEGQRGKNRSLSRATYDGVARPQPIWNR